MYNLFSAEPALEDNFFNERIRAVIDQLKGEGKVQETIYHTENKEAFKYTVTTEIAADTADHLIRSTTSVEKFKLQRDEYLEYIQDTLEGCFVPEKKNSLPLCANHDDPASRALCDSCLRPIAEKHLRCTDKVEKLLSVPKDIVPEKKTRFAFFRLLPLVFLLLLVSVGLFISLPSFDFNKNKGESFPVAFRQNKQASQPPDQEKGYAPVGKDIFPGDNEEVVLEMHPVQYLLSIASNVDNTSISVSCRDGRKHFGAVSRTSTFNVKAIAGTCGISAEKQGYLPVSQEILLTADQQVPIHLRELFFLTVYANMDQSTVSVDGKEVGTAHIKTPATISLPTGTYEVEVANNQAQSPFKKTIHLADDSDLRAVLARPELTIQLNVDNARIKVDKKEHLAKGKQFKLSLPVGTYHLSVRKKEYVPIKKNISLKKDTNISLTLSPVRHPLTLVSAMDNVMISVSCEDGEKHSGTASRKASLTVEVPAGKCEVSAEKKGYIAFSKKIKIFSKQTVTVQLVPKINIIKAVKEKKKGKKKPAGNKTAGNKKRQSAPASDTLRSPSDSNKKCRNEISVGMPELCN
jgi:hypothetical protein